MPDNREVINTRVEKLAEAIEDLMLGVCNARSAAGRRLLDEARANLRVSLREFTLPHLRVIDGARQPYGDDVPSEDRVQCKQCLRHHICADLACSYWHAAVKEAVEAARARPPDDDPPMAA